jgi:hypothetical protein
MFDPKLRLGHRPFAVRNHVIGNPQDQLVTAASMQSNMRFRGNLKVKRPRTKTIGPKKHSSATRHLVPTGSSTRGRCPNPNTTLRCDPPCPAWFCKRLDNGDEGETTDKPFFSPLLISLRALGLCDAVCLPLSARIKHVAAIVAATSAVYAIQYT